jgi:hypothetical protein
MPHPSRPRGACNVSAAGAQRYASATARPDRSVIGVRRQDVSREQSRGRAHSLSTRLRRNFPRAPRSRPALAQGLPREPFAPLRAMGNRTSHMHTSFMRAPFGEASSIDGVQHKAATARHASRRPSPMMRAERATSSLHGASTSSCRPVLMLLKHAVEFSSNKIAAASRGFHVMKHVAGSCLDAVTWLARLNVALTRSEHER